VRTAGDVSSIVQLYRVTSATVQVTSTTIVQQICKLEGFFRIFAEVVNFSERIGFVLEILILKILLNKICLSCMDDFSLIFVLPL
jgi:hypothetical protein